MNTRFRLRLFSLIAVLALMGLMVVVLTFKSRSDAAELRSHLNGLVSESFDIADDFRHRLRELNTALYRYGSVHDPRDLKTFLNAGHDLDAWIDQQKPKLTSEQEKAVFHKIDVAYDHYLAAAKRLQTNLPAQPGESAKVADYAPLLDEADDMFALGQALGKAHFDSRGIIFAQANRTIRNLWFLQLVSLGCVFSFGAALAFMTYRQMIVPLRARLVEGEALLHRREKLAALGMLAAGVAHEIRNPLTAIKGALFLQQKGFDPGSKAAADARLVEREISRLEKIVSNFLLFARPSELQFADTTADAPLRAVHALLAPHLSKKNIRLLLEGVAPLPITIDEAKIEQVLINLVQNAADAIGQDGVVTLRARADRKRIADSPKDVVILEVADTGKGIPPAVEPRLFDPFFTTKETGTGLGLSIAAAIVQEHGGAIQYQTIVDRGTTFGIVLPERIG